MVSNRQVNEAQLGVSITWTGRGLKKASWPKIHKPQLESRLGMMKTKILLKKYAFAF